VAGTVTLFVLGGERLQAFDLKTWTDDGELAWDSTPLLVRLRGKMWSGSPPSTRLTHGPGMPRLPGSPAAPGLRPDPVDRGSPSQPKL
jgi:hypothetical protein